MWGATDGPRVIVEKGDPLAPRRANIRATSVYTQLDTEWYSELADVGSAYIVSNYNLGNQMIRRSERPKDHYTVIANDVLRDEQLSFRARGILAAILSRPDNWTIKSDLLAQQGKEGRDAIRSALKELRDANYLHLEKMRNPDGTFTTVQVVYDRPTTFPQVAPETENQASENQASDSQASIEVKRRKKEKKISSSSDDDGFADFWKLYPRKVGKGGAERAWKAALKKASKETILEGLATYQALRAGQDETYTAHPTTWLNQERWADETVNPETPEPETPQPNIPAWEPCDQCAGGWVYETDDQGYEYARPCICRP